MHHNGVNSHRGKTSQRGLSELLRNQKAKARQDQRYTRNGTIEGRSPDVQTSAQRYSFVPDSLMAT